MSKNKLLFLISISLMFLYFGCVDTGVENISPQDYRSSVRVENDATAAATVTVGSSSVGNVATGQTSGYVEIPSGSRNVRATFPAGPEINQSITFESDLRITLSIVEDSTGARSLVKHIDGYR